MSGSVPTMSIVVICINILLAFILPAALYLFLRRKYHGDHKAFWVGVAVFIVFSGVLERMVHSLVLMSPMGSSIQSNVWLLALYGGLMAALFEESGRYVAFRTMLAKNLGNNHNALMYGAGHGGIEVVMVLGITMVNNLVYTFMLNSGRAGVIMESLDPHQQQVLAAVFSQLQNTTPALYFAGLLERIAALAIHMSLSVLVWFSVKDRKSFYLFPVAFAIHFIVDVVAVLLSRSGMGVYFIELVVWLLAGLSCLFAWRVWVVSTEKKNGPPCVDDSPF